jgi:hypothetical protein
MSETKTIKIDVDAQQAIDSMDDLTKATKKAGDQFDATASFAQRYGEELQPLTTRMGEAEDRLYELANAGETASQEYKDLLETVGNYRKVQIQTDMAVDAAATTMTQKLGGALGGVTAGFELGQGVMGAFGAESEQLEKALLKVQSAMAISQGLQGFKEAIPSFTALKNTAVGAFQGMTTASKVFMVSGIGLLITALGVLIAKWDDVKGALTPATTEAKKFEKSTRESAEAARYALENFDEYERTLKRLGYTEEQIASKRKQRFKEAIEQTRKEIKAAEQVYKAQKDNLETVAIFDSLGLNATGRALFGDEEEAKAQRKRVKQLRDDLAKVKNDEYEFRQQQKQVKEEKKKEEEEEKKAANDRAKDAAQKRKDELAQLAQYNREATDVFKSEFEKQKRDLEEKYAVQIALAKKYNKDTVDLEKAKNKELEDLQLTQVDLTRGGLEKVQIATIKSINTTKEFQEQQKKGLVGVQEVRERIFKREQEIDEAKRKGQEDALTATAGTLGQIAELFGKQTAAGKAAAIAEATINTFLSAQKAYTSTVGIPVVGPVLAPINAGLAIAAGIKNIKAITAVQTPDGGGGGGGGVSNSFASAAPQAPNFNVVGNSGMNQLAQIQQQPIQAYVVSGEVTSAQALDRNRIKNATL